MQITVDIDQRLVREAMRISGAPRKKAVIEAGLRLLIQTHAQAGLRKFRGTVHWEGDLDVSRRGRIGQARRSKASRLDVKGAMLSVSKSDRVAIVHKG